MIDIIEENDGTNSIFIYIENVLEKKNYNLLKNELKKMNDWEGGKIDDNKRIQRLQKWYQVDNNPFCKKWKTKYKRWESHIYNNLLFNIQDIINKKVLELLPVDDFIQKPLYNSILINLYRNGNDIIPPHQDTHISFGRTPTISNLSIGESRTLILERTFKDKLNRNKEEYYLNKKYLLNNNSLFIMSGSSQRYYCHSIKKDNTINERYSLTFREYL
jgi:alkylated DNA repair dioxygenase AlkB